MKKISRASEPLALSEGQDLRADNQTAPRVYYEDESVTLYHGDCTAVMRLLAFVGMVDHVLTDPPYARDVYLRLRNPDSASGDAGRVRRGNGSLTRPNAHHSSAGHQPARLERLAAGDIGAIDGILDETAGLIASITRRWVIVFSDAETTWRWQAALVVAGMRYIRTGAWVKPDAMPQMTGDRPGTGFEPCTITHAQGPMRWNGGGSLAVWTHFTSKGDARPDHPCPKPLPLMVELVTLFTDQGETILDPFAGSGTTLVAAKLNGRKAIGIEKSEQYCEVAAKRLQATEPGRLFDKVPKAKPGAFSFSDAVDPHAEGRESGPRA